MPSIRLLDLTNLVALSPSKHFFNRLLGIGYYSPVHYETHKPIIDDLEARISTIRESL